MPKKHLKGMEVREITGAMTKEGKFVAKNGLRIKDKKVEELSYSEIEKANTVKLKEEKEHEI